jgi:hypothetical protein
METLPRSCPKRSFGRAAPTSQIGKMLEWRSTLRESKPEAMEHSEIRKFLSGSAAQM